MIAPGGAVPPSSGAEYSGAWVALLDGQGRVLFDRALHDPFRALVEVHYSPARGSRVVTGRREAGEFDVVVPDMPGQLPVATDPAYLALLDDRADAEQLPPHGIPIGDPWRIRIPTTLVMLQDDLTLTPNPPKPTPGP
jgi:hypothetical protein